MKKWVFLGIIAAAALWLVGAYATRPSVEASLKTAAETLLAKPEHLKAFDEVKVEFSGQQAQLTGQVTTLDDKALAGQLIKNDVRVTRWFGSGLNPVTVVINGIQPSNERAYLKPQPWLIASLFSDQARLSGTVADASAAKAATDAITKQLGTAKLNASIMEVAQDRPAKDWAATLASVPDLKDALSKAKPNEGIVAVSACDGKWTLFSGNDSAVDIAEKGLAAAATLPSSVGAALNDLSTWQTAEREKIRIAALPAAVAAVTLLPNAVHLFGAIGDPADQKNLVEGLTANYKGLRVIDHTTLSGDVKPGASWSTSLASLPAKTDPASAAVLRSNDKALVWSGKDAAEGLKKELATALPKGITPDALQATIDAYAVEKKAADEAAAKATADKAKADAEAKAAADKAKMAAPPAPVTPVSPATATSAPVAAPSPAYLGWTLTGTTLALFGALPDNATLTAAKTAAAAAYPGTTINTDAIIIDTKRTLPAGATAQFTAAAAGAKPQINIAAVGSPAKSYAIDAFDSEIAKDWPQLSFAEGELSKSLTTFRTEQIKSGSLKQDEPYLSIISNGKTLTVVGEVADAATKDQLIAAIKAANPGFIIDDRLIVTPLVRATADISATLASLPKFEEGKPGSAAAKPGEKARAGVLHAIYFATGSDRSKDQERALYQARRLFTLVPTAKLEIVGNTDNVGAADANTKLSQDRADKFGSYLEAAGISKATFTTRGAGPTAPIADNNTDTGKALNRRVDVLVK